MTQEKKTIIIANIYLIIAAAIWGSNYIFQKIVATEIGPFTFMSLRSLLGSLTILFIIAVNNRKTNKTLDDSSLPIQKEEYSLRNKKYRRRLIKLSVLCGCINVTGSVLVQWGLLYTDASKASFLNAIYIIFVPIIGLLFFRQKTSINTIFGVLLSIVGLYFLCAKEGMLFKIGDLLVLASTLFFALHIQLISKYVHQLKGIHLACLEFFFASIYCAIMAFLVESPSMDQILSCSYSILFAGILGIGVCYALQFSAQKHTDPTVAALLMSLESVFGALGGVFVLGEHFSLREFFGVIFIVAAIILAQLPIRNIRKTKTRSN